jgi:hypothetical protein
MGDMLVWGQFWDPNVNQDTVRKHSSRAFDSCNKNVVVPVAEILGDPYSKKSLLPSIGNFPHLADFPKLSSYQVLGPLAIIIQE